MANFNPFQSILLPQSRTVIFAKDKKNKLIQKGIATKFAIKIVVLYFLLANIFYTSDLTFCCSLCLFFSTEAAECATRHALLCFCATVLLAKWNGMRRLPVHCKQNDSK